MKCKVFHVISLFEYVLASVSIAYVLAETNLKGENPKDYTVSCHDNETCWEHYTPNLNIALEYNYTNVVHKPYCSGLANDKNGQCACEEGFCLSRSRDVDEEPFYYCGPCGRIGSECNSTIKCYQEVSICNDGFCDCDNNGIFQELYICYISFYGYEMALQVAILTCIVVAFCLLIASIYNAVGFRRLTYQDPIRNLLRRNNSTVRVSSDTPPKYEDIMEDLPSYQEAIVMEAERSNNGLENHGFDLSSEEAIQSQTSQASGLVLQNNEEDTSTKSEEKVQNFATLSHRNNNFSLSSL